MFTATAEKIVLLSRDPRECGMCLATQKAFDRHGINEKFEVEKIDLDTLPAEQLAELREQGLMQAPVVVAPFGTYTGFRPDVVKQLADYASERDEVDAALAS